MATPFIPRLLNPQDLLKQKSYFLLGPRQTGKSALIRHTLSGVRTYNLLDHATFLDLSQNPKRLAQEIGPKEHTVVIDEIQRLPSLLNEIHLLIEERKIRFLLTGSSARKLRHGGVNLLGGRARTVHLHPFVWMELKDRFDLNRALNQSLVPGLYFSDNPKADLDAYTGSYLKEEIIAEAATRNVPAFTRFLRIAALANGTVVNFTNVSNDAQVARTTVYEYFEILKDTLLLHEVPAWQKSIKRKPLVSSKYYFFDAGVAGHLQQRKFQPGTPEYGSAFETYILHELMSYRDYRSAETVCYWRTTSGFEVDFILGDHTAIEVKAKATVSDPDLKTLRALQEEKKLKRALCVSLEKRKRTVHGIEILPYTDFLEKLWAGEYR